MFIIISRIFRARGFKQDLIANLHADITVKSNEGKTLPDIDKATKILSENTEIAHYYSKVIEERVYINFRENGDIANLRG